MNVKRSLYTEYIVDLHIQTTGTNMIRHTIFTIFCLTIAFSAYAVDTHIKDSLLQQLTQLIINRLSRDIYIDPAYNQGTRVIVTLPIV